MKSNTCAPPLTSGTDSEVFLVPRAIYKDPFRPNGENILVMCDCYEPPRTAEDGTSIPMKAIPTNTRAACAAAMKAAEAEVPWFGIEQVCECVCVMEGGSFIHAARGHAAHALT